VASVLRWRLWLLWEDGPGCELGHGWLSLADVRRFAETVRANLEMRDSISGACWQRVDGQWRRGGKKREA
jgi:hypothetical protein